MRGDTGHRLEVGAVLSGAALLLAGGWFRWIRTTQESNRPARIWGQQPGFQPTDAVIVVLVAICVLAVVARWRHAPAILVTIGGGYLAAIVGFLYWVLVIGGWWPGKAPALGALLTILGASVFFVLGAKDISIQIEYRK